MGIDTSQLDSLIADLGRAPASVEAKARRAVAETTTDIERAMLASAPVRLGLLKGSIRARRLGLYGEVGSDTDYDSYVEYGTSDTAPQPFARPSFDAHQGRLDERLGDAGGSIL